MKIKTKIERKGMLAGKRAINKVLAAVRETMREALQYWHKTYRKFHFTESAFRRYPEVYKARLDRYQRYKRRRVGHDKPLVLKGRLERSTKHIVRITGGRKRTTLTMRGTPYVNLRPSGTHGKSVKLSKQIVKVSRAERKELARFVRLYLSGRLKAIKEKVTSWT